MIGIIANPASGKDIRRLVAQGTVFNNMEKVNIVQRILAIIHNEGTSDVRMMPDSFDIMGKACLGLQRSLKIIPNVEAIPMDCNHDQTDTTVAAKWLCDAGATVIITLGGDGTNRAVAKTCGDVPLIPISTGTNNVFPIMCEGTIAGMAAAVADKETDFLDLRRCKKLHVLKNGEDVDIALVDAVITEDLFIGSRAVWQAEDIRELFVTTARPDTIGMSAIAGSFHPMPIEDPNGLYIHIGESTFKIHAPIAPGMLTEISIEDYKVMKPGEVITAMTKTGIVALDGEREVPFNSTDTLEVVCRPDGPLVVNIEKTLENRAKGAFVK